jgi:5'-3' exoribonuclease 1
MPNLFDSNAISPGTKFMADLCQQLHFFVKYKINTDPLYQKLESCVLSDGAVPGEGEHKMLDYIRQLRQKPGYDPNTRHCFYGSDADLIMLSLLTHEPNFTIIREEHVVRRQKPAGGVQRVELATTSNFQLIHISLLREYFMMEYKSLQGKLKMRFNLERIIDDFVFFCFFIGNDFMPSLSALDIAEGSLDKLIDFYKETLPALEDYVTDSGVIHWDRAEKFIQVLASHENEVFKNRIDEIDYRAKHAKEETTVSLSLEVQQMMGSQT